VLCCAVLCCAVLCCAVLCCAVLCCLLHCAVMCCAVRAVVLACMPPAHYCARHRPFGDRCLRLQGGSLRSRWRSLYDAVHRWCGDEGDGLPYELCVPYGYLSCHLLHGDICTYAHATPRHATPRHRSTQAQHTAHCTLHTARSTVPHCAVLCLAGDSLLCLI
jgi:hypothetical protein